MTMRDVIPSFGNALAAARHRAKTGLTAARKARKPMIYKGELTLRHLAHPSDTGAVQFEEVWVRSRNDRFNITGSVI
jgi:hypothetical protein